MWVKAASEIFTTAVLKFGCPTPINFLHVAEFRILIPDVHEDANCLIRSNFIDSAHKCILKKRFAHKCKSYLIVITTQHSLST